MLQTNRSKLNLDESLEGSVRLTNIGEYDGEEVVQLYVHDLVGSTTRPIKELKGQDLADATSMLAQGYVNTKSLDSAITQLEIAANATKSNDELGRYKFIQGQLYNALDKKDSANLAFNNVIELNRKTPRIYLISAHIAKAKNFDFSSGNKLEFLELLTDLEEDRENRPFLDKIYHQIAEYHKQNGSDTLAVTYYNKSLRKITIVEHNTKEVS